ncbi:MAG: 16S rRNA (cytosine(1402)-N(4))-methyltransferase RsmH [Gemmatimonadota bacterium]
MTDQLPADRHVPVLVNQVLAAAGPGGRAVDGTLGDGGHALALVEAGFEVLGVDRDPQAIARASDRLAGHPARILQGRFDDPAILEAVTTFRPDFVLLDLGVSSRQLDDDRLGFSFRPGAPLDMRMDRAGEGAAAYLNEAPVAELRETFARLADEPRARRLALEIDRRRQTTPFETSDDLVNAIRGALGASSGPGDFARIFQGVRIRVNDELDRLNRALPALRDALAPGGTLAVISYHSGEDRIVKHLFREWGRQCICPPVFPVCQCRGRALGTVVSRRPILPTDLEVESNPRARSAKLRLFRVTG